MLIVSKNNSFSSCILIDTSFWIVSFTSKIEAQQVFYDERLRAVRVEVTKQRESIKLDAEGSAQQKLQQANDKARVLRQESTQKIQGESQEAMSILQNKISSYTQEALTKILA